MKAPAIFVVVKRNYDSAYHDYLCWTFDEYEANDEAKRINTELGDEWRCQVERIDSLGGVPRERP